jgi:hypothetical protein
MAPGHPFKKTITFAEFSGYIQTHTYIHMLTSVLRYFFELHISELQVFERPSTKKWKNGKKL